MKNLEIKTKKMSLANIEGKLSVTEMENIMAGSGFCTGFGAVAIGYEAGVLMNLWNPIGWGGQAALLVVSGYCLTR
jgi:hypothetical protein